MKTLTRIFIVAFAMLFLGIVSQVGVHAASNDYYYSCDGIANAYEIDLSNEKLYACRDKITNPVNVENLVSYTNSITKSYQVHIYHYYVPYDGYYTAYTTGSKDTKIRLYRENQILWWIDGFIGFDRTEDDGSKCDNNFYNACSIEYLAKGYYYVAVRMYGTATGSYTINIGPNEDLIYRPKFTGYNCWISDTKIQWEPNFKNEWCYFSKEETLFFYWLLTSKASITINVKEYVEKFGKASINANELIALYESNPSLAIDIAGQIAGFLCSATGADPAVSIGVSVGFFALSYGISSLRNYYNEKFMSDFIKNCGVTVHIDGIESNGMTIRINVERGLLLKHQAIPTSTFPFVTIEACGYDLNTMFLRGDKCDKGHWIKSK